MYKWSRFIKWWHKQDNDIYTMELPMRSVWSQWTKSYHNKMEKAPDDGWFCGEWLSLNNLYRWERITSHSKSESHSNRNGLVSIFTTILAYKQRKKKKWKKKKEKKRRKTNNILKLSYFVHYTELQCPVLTVIDRKYITLGLMLSKMTST